MVFFGIGLIRLGVPSEQIFDEVYHARTAMEYIAGVNPYEWTHPPLAKLLAAASVLLFNGQFDLAAKVWTEHQAFAWRFSSLFFGALALMVMYALTRSLFNNRTIATLATAFLALDGVFFVQSRVAMTNIYEVFFILLGTLGTWLYIKNDKAPWLLLTGFGLGCALACRWSSLYAWGLTGLLLLWHVWSVKRHQWGAVPAAEATSLSAQVGSALQAVNKAAVAKWLGLLALTMGLIPVVIYFLTYIPFVLQGDGSWQIKLFTWNANGHGWGKVISQQKDMWGYHAGLQATHPYSSPWWSWPLMLRPTWYYFHDWKNGTVSGVWAIGNAFIWWLSVPALAYAGYLAWRDKLKSLGLVTLMGFGLWIMWGVQPRPLLYMHYMFETIPFACMAIAYTCYLLWNGKPDFSNVQPMPGDSPQASAKAATPPLSAAGQKVLALAIGGAIVAWFIFYYPLLAAIPIPWPFYNLHLWYNRAWI
ncbi:putative dolichyl-phosphate-mannose--protein mannosyltransferase [compost metagenome]